MAKAKDTVTHGDGTTRCWWCGDDPLYVDYHDREWGVPVDDDQRLFEKICLEGFQAGLSWITILRNARVVSHRVRKFRLSQSGPLPSEESRAFGRRFEHREAPRQDRIDDQ